MEKKELKQEIENKRKYGQFADVVKVYIETIEKENPQIKERISRQLTSLKLKIASGEKNKFSYAGLHYWRPKLGEEIEIAHSIRVFTSRIDYNIDLKQEDFGMLFNFAEQRLKQDVVKEDELSPEFKQVSFKKKMNQIATVFHEINHAICDLEINNVDKYQNKPLGKNEVCLDVKLGGLPVYKFLITQDNKLKKCDKNPVWLYLHEGLTEYIRVIYSCKKDVRQLKFYGLDNEARQVYALSYKLYYAVAGLLDVANKEILQKAYLDYAHFDEKQKILFNNTAGAFFPLGNEIVKFSKIKSSEISLEVKNRIITLTKSIMDFCAKQKKIIENNDEIGIYNEIEIKRLNYYFNMLLNPEKWRHSLAGSLSSLKKEERKKIVDAFVANFELEVKKQNLVLDLRTGKEQEQNQQILCVQQ